MRVGGEEKMGVLEAGSLRRPRASPGPGFSDFPHRQGKPGEPLWAVCLLQTRIWLIWFLNSGLAAFWAGPGVG